jgi:6-phosphogluconolactonase
MRFRQFVAMSLFLELSVLSAHAAAPVDEFVYVGTYVFGPPSHAEVSDQRAAPQQGIYGARLDVGTGRLSSLGLSVEIKRASWLITHPSLPILYSLSQIPGDNPASDSAVISFAIDPKSGALRQLNQMDAHGLDATHMAFDAASQTVFVAHHGSGNLTDLPVESDGSLRPVASDLKDFGSGPTARQKSAMAHGVAVDPTHHDVVVADFGADRLFVYRFDGASRLLTPATVPFLQLSPGSGPRHLLFHPKGRFLFVNNELTGEICSYQWDSRGERLTLAHCRSPYSADYSGRKSAAEISISRDGRFLYLSLRGDQEALIAYAIDMVSGALTEIQRISPPGKIPWSFGIDPSGRWMVVADQGSNSVAVLAIDAKSGRLTATGESTPIPNPVTVAFYSPLTHPPSRRRGE